MQRNSISRGEWLTSQGSAYLTKPSSPCQNTWTPSATFRRQHLPRTFAACWFGLVNQVANYAQLRDIMAPFKPFLSPRCRFEWTPELERAFQASKESVIAEIRHMVSKSSTQRNEPAYAQVGLVKASGTSCHRNIVRVTRVYLAAVQMVGGSRWPAPDY